MSLFGIYIAIVKIAETENSVSPVPKKDWALVFLGFDWGLLGTLGLGLGLGLDNFCLYFESDSSNLGHW